MRRERQMKLNQMKLSFSICAFLIGFGVIPSMSVSVAQSGWFWQNPLPQGNSLNAVAVLDSDTVTAVGGAGTILRTVDGGATWTFQASGTTKTLNGVSFVDADTGWAVGGTLAYSGTIVRTTNGGATWTSQMSGARFPLYGVSFLNANIGTAVGGFRGVGTGTFEKIVRTIDGGATWTEQTSGASSW